MLGHNNLGYTFGGLALASWGGIYACQFAPLSMLYSKLVPVAVTVIVPSAVPQLVSLVDNTETLVGATLSVKITAVIV